MQNSIDSRKDAKNAKNCKPMLSLPLRALRLCETKISLAEAQRSQRPASRFLLCVLGVFARARSRSDRALWTTALLGAVLAACGGDGRTVLTVYSPHGSDLLSYYEQEFERAYPHVDVQWVDMGSQEVLDRIRAEAANPQADIWFGAPAEIFERASNEGLLEAYTPTWADQLDDDARDPENFWFGTYLTPEVIAYNSDAVSEAEAPRDWDEVLDPRWRGQVLIRDPVASGTMRAIFGGILVRSIKQTGSTEAGFNWLRGLDAQTKEYVLNPTLLYQKLGRQEGLVTLWDMPDIAMLQQRQGFPVRYTVPTSGTPVVVDAIAVVNGTRVPEEARQFYEFVTTREALEHAAERFMRIPARRDIPVEALPQWIRDAQAEIRPMQIDRQLLADSLDIWMRYWDGNIRNRYRTR
jgi:iron(III) transport system substrate-binding protein